jgi:hypothetical protein
MEDEQNPPLPKNSVVTLKPDRVSLNHALELLGDMSRSRFYEKAALGVFDLYKDGAKTVVGVPSIERYNAGMRRAKLGSKFGRVKVEA